MAFFVKRKRRLKKSLPFASLDPSRVSVWREHLFGVRSSSCGICDARKTASAFSQNLRGSSSFATWNTHSITGKIDREIREQSFASKTEADTLADKWWRELGAEKAEYDKQMAQARRAETFAEPPEQIDPADTHRLAGEGDIRDAEAARQIALSRKWPRTLKAMKAKADERAIEEAYLLDTAELTGTERFPPDTPQLAQEVARALHNHSRRTRKNRTLLIDEAIAFHWPKLVYLDNKEFAKAVTILSGIRVTPSQAKQRRVRLNLASRCPAGRRPSE